MSFTKSTFGIKGCLSNPNMDNGKSSGGCSLETRKDSMGYVKQGGCQNSSTGGPGYVNASGWPNCCIDNPPEECITKSNNSSSPPPPPPGNRGITDCSKGIYANDNDKQMCEKTATLQSTYATPPTIFNTTTKSNSTGYVDYGTYNPNPTPIIPPPPPTTKKEQVNYSNWWNRLFGKSSFGSMSSSYMLCILFIVIIIFLIVAKKKKNVSAPVAVTEAVKAAFGIKNLKFTFGKSRF